MSHEKMVKGRKGSKKVVVYEHANGVIFIHPTTREPSGRHKTNSELVEYGNVKDTDEEIGRKIRAMLKKCD